VNIFVGGRVDLKNKRWSSMFLILIFSVVLSACAESEKTQKVAKSEEIVKVENDLAQEEKSDQPAEKPLSEEEIEKILPDVYKNLVDKVYAVGNEQGWVMGTNPPDYEVLRNSIEDYITSGFAENQLKPVMGDLYCQCDAMVFPFPNFDIRFIVTENNADSFKVRTMQVEDEMGGGGYHIFFTVNKEEGQWKLDSFSFVNYFDKPLNITQEEAAKIIKGYDPSAKYIQQAELESPVGFDRANEKYIFDDVNSYLFYLEQENRVYGVVSNSGALIFEIPEELIPQILLEKMKSQNES
jgi:hypothetical protein